MSGMIGVRAVLKPVKDTPATSGIFSDIDGTIAPVALRPQDVRVGKLAKTILASLVDRYRICSLVTGRDISYATKMVGIDGLSFIGSHGLEAMIDDEYVCAPGAEEYLTLIPELAEKLEREMPVDGVEIEKKRFTIGLHYRNAEDHNASRDLILRTVEPLLVEYRLRWMQARQAIEILPDLPSDKGTALTRVMEKVSLDALAYFGDDTTDLAAFGAVEEVCYRGCAGVKVAVGSAETPPELLERADVILDGVDEVLEALTWLAE